MNQLNMGDNILKTDPVGGWRKKGAQIDRCEDDMYDSCFCQG